MPTTRQSDRSDCFRVAERFVSKEAPLRARLSEVDVAHQLVSRVIQY